MPIRFRRRLKIAPGVWLNLSKSGASTSVGKRGFHLTFGKKGVRESVGIPGTGISEYHYISKNKDSEEEKEKKQEQRREAREEKRAEEHDTPVAEERSHARKNHSRARTERAESANGGSTVLRNLFVMLGIVVFFFAGAAVLGLLPAHFFSNSLLFLTHLIQSTGH